MNNNASHRITKSRLGRLPSLTIALAVIALLPLDRATAGPPLRNSNGDLLPEEETLSDLHFSSRPAEMDWLSSRLASIAREMDAEFAQPVAAPNRAPIILPNAVTGPSTWNGGTGNWSNGAMWTPIDPPNSAGADVSIDGGNVVTSAVTIDGTFTVGRVTIDSGDTLTLQNNRTFTVTDTGGFTGAGSIVNNGSFSLLSGGSFTDLVMTGSVNLTGSGTLTLANAARIRGGGTLNNFSTIQGEANNTGSGLGNNELTIVNQVGGLVDANVSGGVLNVNPGAGGLTNGGTLRASGGGVLQLNGTSGGGFADIGGVGMIQALAGSRVDLISGAAITGGTLATSGNGVIRNVNGATLSDVTNTGTFIGLNGTQDAGATFLVGTITNNGSITLQSTGNFTDLTINGAVTLNGTGTVNLQDAARIRGSGTLTNNSTIQGAANNSGSGLGFNELAIVNTASGLVHANVSGGTLNVNPGPTGGLTNQGTLRASGGGILLLNGSGGGGFTNTVGTIEALTGSRVDLFTGAAITGGTLTTSGTGVIRNTGGTGGTLLTDLTNAGAFVGFNGTADGLATFLAGTINNTGSISLASTGNFTDLTLTGNVSLTGGGTVNVSSAARIRGSGTLTSNNVIQGENQNSGSIGANEIGLINLAGGLIDANDATGLLLRVDPSSAGNLVNQGTMRASNGGVLLLTGSGGGGFTNTVGTIEALTGSRVDLFTGAAITGGTLTTSGTGVIRNTGGTGGTLLTDLTNAGSFTGINGTQDGGATFLAGTINNTGSISVASTGSFTDLTTTGDVTLTGGGTVNLSSAARIRGSGTLTSNNVIQGENQNSGSIGANEIGLINLAGGLIDANNATGLLLRVDPSSAGNLVNQGTMRASNGGVLLLTGSGGGTFDNTFGTISALAGSRVDLVAGAAITGGTLSTSDTGVIRNAGSGGTTLTNLTLAGSFTGINGTQDGGATFLSGTITNTGSITVASTGSFTDLTMNGDVTLTGGGMVNVQNASRIRGSGRLTSNNTIQGENQNSGSVGTNEIAITNQGLIHANVLNLNLRIDPANIATDAFLNDTAGIVRASSGGRIVLAAGSGTSGAFTNNGIFEVLDGSLFTMDGAAVLTNNVAGVLTGGSYRAIATGGGATMTLRGAGITEIDLGTEVILSGAGSLIQFGTTAIETALTQLDGTLRALVNRNYQNVNALTVTGTGVLELGGGIFNAPSLTINIGGELFGFGNVTPRPTNAGLIRAVGGTLAFASGINGGSGTVQIDPTGILDLSASGAASSADFLFHNGNTTPSLLLGSQNFVVSLDYTNANFGAGNTFNPRANVSGTGSINAAGNVAQSLSGNVINGTSAAPAMDFGNVHVGDSPTRSYQINNLGSAGPALRGALQTSINGGNITDLRLGGSGVTASNFGPIALAGNSGTLGVTFNATSAGALTAQVLHIINNFDNVGEQDLTITGAAFRFANPVLNTTVPVAFGNFHVGDVAPSALLSVTNNVPADSFSESLDAAIGNATGGVLTNGGSFTGLAPTATNSTSLGVAISTAAAGSQNGSATITFQSNGSGSSGLGLSALTSQTVNVTGAVFRLAAPVVTAADPIAFGIRHIGDSVSNLSLSIKNDVLADGFSESLNASIGSGTNGVTTSGSVTGLAPGLSSAALGVGIDTSSAGLRNGTATITLQSNGAGSSELGLTDLLSQTVNVTGQVNFFADPLLIFKTGTATLTMNSSTSFTLDFGQVAQNSGTYLASFGVQNFLHSANFQDTLGGQFDTTLVTDFGVTGFDPFTNIAPGSDSDPDVSFDSNKAFGLYANNVTLTPSSSNASGTTTLADIQLTLRAQIIPEPGTWAMLLAGGGMLLFLQRARRRR